jgi:hypothetical protein
MPIRSCEIPPNSWVSLSGTTTFFADRCLVKSIRTSHILCPRCRLAGLKWHQGPSSEARVSRLMGEIHQFTSLNTGMTDTQESNATCFPRWQDEPTYRLECSNYRQPAQRVSCSALGLCLTALLACTNQSRRNPCARSNGPIHVRSRSKGSGANLKSWLCGVNG